MQILQVGHQIYVDVLGSKVNEVYAWKQKS